MVTSFTQLLAQRYQDQLDRDAEQIIGFAVEGAKRMEALIRGLLTYSRLASKEKSFELTNCNEVLDLALSNLHIQIQETDTTICRHPLPALWGDKLQLVQLWQNLLSNAIKYRSDRPLEIEVGAEAQTGSWLFYVKDNGIGIEPRYFERIFAIFQRLHTRTQYPGTGIGLSFCQKIVERHGGKIWVESEPGQGSTFYFTVPITP